MTASSTPSTVRPAAATSTGWRELWLKEDWWAVWLGLGLVIVAYGLFANGLSLKWIAVTPEKWATADQLLRHFAANAPRYLAQFALWVVVFAVALSALGYSARDFLPSFVFLYVISLGIFVVGQWTEANTYNLEPPLVALLLGLLISNTVGLPGWMDAGFRVEFYVKTGVVLLGATLPFSLIAWAGPVAILQASIVSIVTFLVIFFAARRLGLDRPSRRRLAQAAPSAASRPRSPSPPPSAQRRNMRRSRSPSSSSGRS
jgi:integral membrane protein